MIDVDCLMANMGQRSECVELAVQAAEKEAHDAAREVAALQQDKQDLAATVEQLQSDLEAEHKLNEEMHDILATFRRQHSGPPA